MSGIGHNNGPSMESGFGFRKMAWAKARSDLIPNLPIEILRRRVLRAKELGLPYKTYASVRASTGRDVIGFLFSNNALRVLRAEQAVPAGRVAKLMALKGAKIFAAAHPPVSPKCLSERLRVQGLCLDAASKAPHFADAWSEIRSAIAAPLENQKVPKDGILVIGDTSHEALWSEAAKLAGFVQSDCYFGEATQGR